MDKEDAVDKATLESLIREDSDRIKYVDCGKRKQFKRVHLDGKDSKYVKCNDCTDVKLIKYASGTNGLIKHEKSHGVIPTRETGKQLTLHQVLPEKLTREEKYRINDAAGMWSAIGMVPLSITENEGTKYFVKELIDVLHKKKGKVTVEDVLPCHKTVNKHVMKMSNNKRALMKEDFTGMKYFHATCDHWNEKRSKRDFFTVTLHFVRPGNQNISSIVIGTKETTSKGNEQIKKDLKCIADLYGITSRIKTMVTDNFSANIKAFDQRQDISWFPCSAHNLNLCLSHAFDFKPEDIANESPLHDINQLIDSCKNIVTYSKQAGLNSSLETSLKQSVETRWDSTLTLLESIDASFDKLLELAEEKPGLEEKLLQINRPLLKLLIPLLLPFRIAREKLCRNSLPTFHEVAVIKEFLIYKHCKESVSDMSVIKILKKRLRRSVMQYFEVTQEHLIASYLTPGLKVNFLQKFHDQTMVSNARQLLRTLFSDAIKALKEKETATVIEESEEIPAKVLKSNDMLSDFYSVTVSSQRTSLSEIEKYQVMFVTESDKDDSPIVFWQRNSHLFPNLSVIAIKLLSIPATSVKSEQNFSAAGHMMNDKRANLGSDVLDALLYLKSNHSMLIKQ